MSSLVKSAINFRVSCFVNFKANKDGFEFASLNPKVQYKDKDTGEYKESKYWSLEEAQAMIQCLGRAIAHAEDRLQPIKNTGEKNNQEFEKSYVKVEGQAEPIQVEFDDSDIPF